MTGTLLSLLGAFTVGSLWGIAVRYPDTRAGRSLWLVSAVSVGAAWGFLVGWMM